MSSQPNTGAGTPPTCTAKGTGARVQGSRKYACGRRVFEGANDPKGRERCLFTGGGTGVGERDERCFAPSYACCANMIGDRPYIRSLPDSASAFMMDVSRGGGSSDSGVSLPQCRSDTAERERVIFALALIPKRVDGRATISFLKIGFRV